MSQADAGQVGWIAPDAKSPRTSLARFMLVGVGVLVLVLVVGFVGLSFLGAQVKAELRGTIEFGTAGGSSCSVVGSTNSFINGTSVYTAAHLSRDVTAGSTVTIRVFQDGTEVASNSQTFNTTGDCLVQTLSGEALSPGHYRVEYLAGSELLASGEFDTQPE